VESAAVLDGLAGKSGVKEVTDYRGTQVQSAYGPVEFQGAKWALLVEIEIPGTERADELGVMAQAVEVFKQSGLEVRRLEAIQKEREAQEAEERKRIRLQRSR
jgi:hypothetical protein